MLALSLTPVDLHPLRPLTTSRLAFSGDVAMWKYRPIGLRFLHHLASSASGGASPLLAQVKRRRARPFSPVTPESFCRLQNSTGGGMNGDDGWSRGPPTRTRVIYLRSRRDDASSRCFTLSDHLFVRRGGGQRGRGGRGEGVIRIYGVNLQSRKGDR